MKLIEQNAKKINEIHQALLGDEFRNGLVEEVKVLKKESFIHKVAISIATVLSALFAYLFNH